MYLLTRSASIALHLYAVDSQGGRTRYQIYTVIGHELRIRLRQETPYGAVGTDKSIIANLEDENGAPLSYYWVNFDVTGANTVSGSSVALEDAQAIFSYRGANAGVDVIQASVYGFPFIAR